MPRLTEEAKTARRQQIIDAAWRCVRDHAFQSLTVDDVCADAGVSKGAFYVYFEQKQDLLLGMLDDEANEIDEVMAELEREHLTGVERMRRFARAMIERGDDPSRLQLRADLWAETSSSDAVRERWIEVVRLRRETLRRWIEEGIASGEFSPMPANALAAIVLALGDGLLLHAGLDPSGFGWANIRWALDAILEGIGDR